MDRFREITDRIAEIMQHFAETTGGPGLAIVAFLDSSFLSLPEVADLLIVVFVVHNPPAWLYYAAMTTLGSVAGCFALYSVGRRGGEAFLRRRFKARHIDRALGLFRRYGLLSVIIPSILPPPMPFKIFVLLAGVANVRPATFILATVIGRGFRYGAEALLAYMYGEQATRLLRENLPAVSLYLAIAIALLGVAYIVWRRRRSAGPRVTST